MGPWLENCFVKRFHKLGFWSARGNAISTLRGQLWKYVDWYIVGSVPIWDLPKYTYRPDDRT